MRSDAKRRSGTTCAERSGAATLTSHDHVVRDLSLCEANCGIAVEHEGAEILKIHGDDDDHFSGGYICPKAAALTDVHVDPDRLRRPLRRNGDRWTEVPWDEALDEAAERMAAIQKEHGRNALAVYVGNPTAHSYSALMYAQVLNMALRTRSVFTANSVNASPRVLTSYLLCGSQALLPVPDLERTKLLPDLRREPRGVERQPHDRARRAARARRRIRARGGKRGGGRSAAHRDGRRSPTSTSSSGPGTDALLLSAMLH